MAFASEKIYAFIMDYEKYGDRLYNDDAGNTTIGYGHLVHFGRVGTNKNAEREFENGITKEKAIRLLKADIKAKGEDCVNKRVTARLTQNQFDALVSFVYNVGAEHFAGSSLLRNVNSNVADPEAIARSFKQWNKGKTHGVLKEFVGLTLRRKQEADIYNKNVYVSNH